MVEPRSITRDEFKALCDDSYGGPLDTLTGIAYRIEAWPTTDYRSSLLRLEADGPVNANGRTKWYVVDTEPKYSGNRRIALTWALNQTSEDIEAEEG